MILSESQAEAINQLEEIKKRVLLLESHRTLKFITKKQYEDSMIAICRELDLFQVKHGIYEKEEIGAEEFLYGNGAQKLEKSLDDVYGALAQCDIDVETEEDMFPC